MPSGCGHGTFASCLILQTHILDVSFDNQIIEDARVLTADYLPNRMVHRDNERQQIARNLEPILEGQPPLDMLLYGPPGTGKTAMANYVIKQLHKHSSELESSTIDCFSQPSRFELFYNLVRDTGEFVTRDGTSTEALIDKFEEKARRRPIVVVVDEIDQLTNEEVLFELSRFRDVGLIMISNRRDVFAHLDDRVRSRFSERDELKFSPYSNDEMSDILNDRREYGLKPEAASDKVLEAIAERSAGDARVAIGSLRIAAQKSENQDLEEIKMEVVENSMEDAIEEEQSLSLEKLNRHQRAMYDILKEENKDMKSGELFEQYREEVEDPVVKRTLRRYLKKMEDYGLIKSKGKKRGRKYSLTS